MQSFTLPAGKWRVFWAVRSYGDSVQNGVIYAGLKIDGDKVQDLAANGATSGGVLRPYISCSYEANITATSTLSTYITMAMSSNVSVETTYLFALRVG